MADHSAIQWTDATWNPVRGCTKVSPGCAHCYAETFAERFRGVKGHPYEQGFDLRLVPEKLEEPLKWKTPRRVFVNSMSDLFQDGVPDQFLHDVYHVMEHCQQHTFQVLTKRAARMQAYLTWRYGPDEETPRGRIPSRHIWHGVSVENQHAADLRLPFLLNTPSAVRFISAEPLLEAVSFEGIWGYAGSALYEQLRRWPIHWVIIGGESGPRARRCDLAWVRALLRECRWADVPVFIKQLGARAVSEHGDFDIPRIAGVTRGPRVDQPDYGFRDRKGGNPDEWPADLRVREFPGDRSYPATRRGPFAD